MKTRLFITAFLMIILSFSVISAKTITGSGKVISKKIQLSDFTSIILYSSADVDIEKGDKTSIVLSDYENLINYHKLSVMENSLKISKEPNVSLRKSVAKIKIIVPNVYAIKIIGSGDVVLNSNINTLNQLHIIGSGDVVANANSNFKNIDINISGSGDVRLKGTANNATITVSGSGDIDLTGLKSQFVDCKINGSGDWSLCRKETFG